MKMMNSVYLSGPMTGMPELNYPAFNAVALELRLQGLQVENPAENTPPPCGTWQGWMRLALLQLARCDAIYMLPGWENSRGAKVEHGLAVDLGFQVIYAGSR
jgi:hypothetical protein